MKCRYISTKYFCIWSPWKRSKYIYILSSFNFSQWFLFPINVKCFYFFIHHLHNILHLQDVNIASKLRCRITNRGHPYLLLQPVRIEEFMHDPNVTMFYDVITDKEIETIKSLSLSRVSKLYCTDDIIHARFK